MKFDKSRVYTALNADELKVGSKVIVADNITHLKWFVRDDIIHTLEKIRGENCCYRFIANSGVEYALAYLVEEPEEKKLKWTDLKIGDVITKEGMFAMVTQIDRNDQGHLHIYAGVFWISDSALRDWEKVEE